MLSAQSVSRVYGRGRNRVLAVDGISLDLAPGQRLAVVGQSGSGKSTLARMLALLEQPDAGSIALDGATVTAFGMKTPRPLRRTVQLIWQSPRQSCDDRLRIREIMHEPLLANGLGTPAERREWVAHWVERLGIAPELLERFPHEVSDGQLQRACLARALVLEPRYLVCDEMSSMLDVSTQAALLDVIAQEQERRDLGILLVTHDHILADHWCQSRITLADGRVVEPDTAASVPA